MQQLLIETLTAQQANIITEAVNNGDKDMFLSGIVMQSEVENRNKRKYLREEMLETVRIANEAIRDYGGIFGELDHPADRLQVELKHTSHVITELKMDGDNVHGKIKIMNTPMGMIAKELGRSGVRFGVSSRGTGSVNEGVVTNFNFVTVDIVSTPSCASAYPKTVYESLEQHKQVLTLAEMAQHDEAAQKYFKKEFLKFLETFGNN